MRLQVIHLVAEVVAAVDASHPVEVRGISQLQGEVDLDRAAPGPALYVPEVLAVVEDTGEEGIAGDLPGDLRSYRPNSRDLAVLAILHVLPAALYDLVADEHEEFGTRRVRLHR